jgi:hypothetical protein
MVESTTPTPAWPRPAAPGATCLEGSVALALSSFGPRRPASGRRDHSAARAADSTI